MSDRTESLVTIAAPRSRVMEVIADIAAYPEWNPEVRSVEVLSTAPQGRPERVRYVVDASPIKDIYVLEYDWRGDESVHWHLVEGKLLTSMEGSYSLAESAEGTEVRYALTVELNLPVLGLLRRKGERMIVERALNGLRTRVESH